MLFLRRLGHGSRGGLGKAWDLNDFSLVGLVSRVFSLATTLKSTSTDTTVTATNVYAPADHYFYQDFVDEMLALLPTFDGPWILFGDFNLIC